MVTASNVSDILSAPHRRDLFIAGTIDQQNQAVVLFRGDLDPIIIPLTWFTDDSNADPDALEIIDYGQTVRMGDFEASADAILYEFDPEYRTHARKRALLDDQSLGGSIRRLRLQKGVSRSDFPGVTERTIARIERNESGSRGPNRGTLERIAKRLGVAAEDLSSY